LLIEKELLWVKETIFDKWTMVKVIKVDRSKVIFFKEEAR
jgi:hypothetical protein